MLRQLLLAIALIAPADEDLPRVPPTPPAKAEQTFQTLPGWRMRLVAAEPLVTDPVDMAFDENGLAYVAEMRGYPFPEAEQRTPSGRIRVLWDEDGDGIFDHSRIFCDGLHWPTSVAVWQGGIFVLAPPDLWYLKDTDGDRIADVKQRVATGFGTYNVQAVANNLRWGPDGRFYGAGSGNGGTIRTKTGTITLRRQDFSFDPVSLEFRVETGAGRFGNTFDDFGHRFICNIRNPVMHVVIDYRYLRRNPVTALIRGLHDVAEAGDQVPVFPISKPEPWRLLRARQWAVDPRAIPRSELLAIGYFTSACAATVYRGDAYPEELRNQVFIAEVANNLIHRRKLLRDGVTFRSVRVDQQREIVASTDNWFRPVNFIHAPDGTLYVLDMYREVIEHPWSIPEDLLKRLDLVSGVDRGRIYRLEPADFRPSRPPALREMDTSDLVTLLEHPSAWWSETAQRLLIERHAVEAAPALRQLLRQSQSPRARILAIWTLTRLRQLSTNDLLYALRDRSAPVRAHAVRVAEHHLISNNGAREAVLRLANDPELEVRFQAALTIGNIAPKDDAVVEALSAVAVTDGDDHWVAVAVATSAVGVAKELYERISARLSRSRLPAYGELLELLLATAGREVEPIEAARLLREMAALPPRLRLRFATALLKPLRNQGHPELQKQRSELLALASRVAEDGGTGAAAAVNALTTLGRYAEVRQTLLKLTRGPQASLAIQAIGRYADAQAGKDLLDLATSLQDPLRTTVILQLLRRTSWTEALLEAVEEGRLDPSAIPAQRRWLLTQHPNERIAQRARKLFSQTSTAVTATSVEEIVRSVLKRQGNPQRGAEVFRRECSACHRRHGIGRAIGPDLAALSRRSPEEILVQILDPNREISPEFVQYAVLLTNGRVLAGAIERETGQAIQMLLGDGSRVEVAREDVEEIRPLGVSLMPEGFGEKLSPQELADLLAFLLAREPSAEGR